MKQACLVLIFCLLVPFNKALAQAKMPGFVIADINRKYHNINTASVKKQVLLVYFIPDCDDCRAFTAKLAAHNNLFARYKVIMVTNANLNVLKKFMADFRLNTKKGLMIGTEGWTTTLQRSLKIERFPFVAIYDEKGIMIRKFSDPNSLFGQTL